MRYYASGVRGSDLGSDSAYWDFVRTLSGMGEFIPFREGGREGSFGFWFESDKVVTLKELKERFPSLEINSLETLAA